MKMDLECIVYNLHLLHQLSLQKLWKMEYMDIIWLPQKFHDVQFTYNDMLLVLLILGVILVLSNTESQVFPLLTKSKKYKGCLLLLLSTLSQYHDAWRLNNPIYNSILQILLWIMWADALQTILLPRPCKWLKHSRQKMDFWKLAIGCFRMK